MKMMTASTRVVWAVFICLASGYCIGAQSTHSDVQSKSAAPSAHSGAQARSEAPSQSDLPPNVMIGPNDSITIVSLDSEEISRTWRVSSTGDLDLPLLGRIHAAGLTSEQMEQTLTDGLKRYIHDPQVTVYVSDFRSQPITVAGAVHRPGTYQIENSKTLLEALMLAGGPDAAGPTLILTRTPESGPIPLPGTHEDIDGGRTSIELRLNDVLDPTTPASNLGLKTNDVVAVTSKRRLVYIIGEVAHPGAIELVTQDTVSVMQVLAASGGLTKIASPGHGQIMRVDSQGLYKTVSTIDLKQVMSGKSEDRLLKNGDIVVVPTSTLKTYGQAAALASIATGLAIITRF